MEVHQEKKSACGKFRDDWEFETMFGKMGRNDLEAVYVNFAPGFSFVFCIRSYYVFIFLKFVLSLVCPVVA